MVNIVHHVTILATIPPFITILLNILPVVTIWWTSSQLSLCWWTLSQLSLFVYTIIFHIVTILVRIFPVLTILVDSRTLKYHHLSKLYNIYKGVHAMLKKIESKNYITFVECHYMLVWLRSSLISHKLLLSSPKVLFFVKLL